VEQRIGPNIQPLQGAAVDPAFVPGITGPRPAEPKDAEPRETEPDAESAETAEEAASQETASKDSADSANPASKAPEEEPETETSAKEPHDEEASAEDPEAAESSKSSESSEDSEEAADGGPVFDASDRRARIVADHAGVRLTLDDQQAEFRWDEIGAVETEVPRFGKRFTITVHTPDRRWYPIEIEATARSRFKEWETSLDEVLDTYFEDDAEAEESTP
jgi:hypothetical protein